MKQIGRFRVKDSKIIKVSIITVKVTQIYKHVWITLHFHEEGGVVAEAELKLTLPCYISFKS